jgi:hypothetical protein
MAQQSHSANVAKDEFLRRQDSSFASLNDFRYCPQRRSPRRIGMSAFWVITDVAAGCVTLRW